VVQQVELERFTFEDACVFAKRQKRMRTRKRSS
jgi:hypothetical protein